jgi:hypothetical protein
VFLPLHVVHQLGFSMVIRLVKGFEIITLGFMYSKLIPLGSFGPRWLCGLSGNYFVALWCQLLGSLQ